MENSSAESTIVASDDLPIPESPNFEQLDSSYVTATKLATGVIMGLALGVNLVIQWASGNISQFLAWDYGWTIIAGIAVIFVLALSLPRVFWRAMGYQLRGQDVHFKRGVVWRSVTSLPYIRVQHVELESGPLERIFKLATLKFYAAGGGSADMKIPGLPFGTASKIRSFVLEKAGVEPREEPSDG